MSSRGMSEATGTPSAMSEETGTMAGFYRHSLAHGRVFRDRDELLVSLCSGHRVLHVGCGDAPIAAERLDSDTLLHAQLLQSSESVRGVDIDEESIRLIRNRIGGDYTIADISDEEGRAAVADFDADLILAGDVIEHVANAGAFVNGLGSLLRSSGRSPRLVLSTPNGLSVKVAMNTLFGRELVHPDHVTLYTPVTLEGLLARYGIAVEERYFYHTTSGKGARARVYDTIARVLARMRPAFAEGQVVVCRARTTV